MAKTIDIIWTSILAVLLFRLASLLITPIPIPSLAALILGLILFWTNQKKWYSRLILGLVAGGIIGSAIHLYSHYSKGRMTPAEGLTTHIIFDFIFGIFIALVIAMMVLFAYHFKRGLQSSEF